MMSPVGSKRTCRPPHEMEPMRRPHVYEYTSQFVICSVAADAVRCPQARRTFAIADDKVAKRAFRHAWDAIYRTPLSAR